MRWALLLVVAAGCLQTPAQRAENVCNAFCDCVATGSGAVQSCVDNQCLPQIEMPVSDACVECVYQHEQRCDVLQSSCVQLCLQTQVPDLIGGS